MASVEAVFDWKKFLTDEFGIEEFEEEATEETAEETAEETEEEE